MKCIYVFIYVSI